jgi:hypothetical protein
VERLVGRAGGVSPPVDCVVLLLLLLLLLLEDWVVSGGTVRVPVDTMMVELKVIVTVKTLAPVRMNVNQPITQRDSIRAAESAT